MKLPKREIPSLDRLKALDWCMYHEDDKCDCPAWIVAMGCRDLYFEAMLERGE